MSHGKLQETIYTLYFKGKLILKSKYLYQYVKKKATFSNLGQEVTIKNEYNWETVGRHSTEGINDGMTWRTVYYRDIKFLAFRKPH